MEALKNPSSCRELNNDELSGISGGWWWYIVGGVVFAVTNEICRDWDNFKAGLRGEPEIQH